jgi:molybdopterin molybdotransferase
MISFEDARNAILSKLRPLAAETVSLAEALGRVSAETVLAEADAVAFPRSAMDGYAVRAADCSGASRENPVELPVAGRVFAEKAERALAPGTALSITTGAPLPHGADAVIPHEETKRTDRAVRIFAPFYPGACVFPPGEDIRNGEELVACGEALGPGTLALLAFSGRTKLSVFRHPRVAILCTGDELVDPSSVPEHGQVRNSNMIALTALVAQSGCKPRDRGTARDDPAVLAAMLQAARRQADLLITAGGASAGERDLVKSTLRELGAEFLFEQVAMRPGKPFGYATWRGLPVCVLPGNPAAAFVCFHELVRPALARLAGQNRTKLPEVRACLQGALHSRPGRRYFVLARLDLTTNSFQVTPLENQCSALVRTAADANAIIVLPEAPSETSSRLVPGEVVTVELLDGERTFLSR